MIHRRVITAAAAVAVAATALPCFAGERQLVEEVVATVDTRAILLSEFEVEARLMRARARGAATLGEPMGPLEMRTALDQVVNRLLVFAEAERLQVYEVRGPDVEAARGALVESLGSDALEQFLSRWEVDERTLADLLRREIRVQRYLEGRFRLAARPKENEVLAFLSGRGRTHPSEAEVAEARLVLGRERFGQLVDAYVRDIRRRAKVVVLRDFDAPGSELPKSGHASAREARHE